MALVIVVPLALALTAVQVLEYVQDGRARRRRQKALDSLRWHEDA